MMWIYQIVMLLVALAFIAIPLRVFRERLGNTAIPAGLFVVVLSVLLYRQIGTPDATSLVATNSNNMPSIEQMVASLDARLQQDPNDLDGWKMLGRSYAELRNFPKAIAAYETAVELESGSNGQTLVDLGEVILMSDRSSLGGRAGQLFESSLAIAPSNPKALFYAGMAAVEKGNRELAADRWEALLATSPPANVEQIIRTRIAEWRGEEAPAVAAPAVAAPEKSVITANVTVDDAAAGAIDPGATLFLIARDPGQPRPPIAAVRRQAGELPAAIALSDADAMIPGRVPSGFQELEIIARVSGSGEPTAQPGDWFGQAILDTANGSEIDIVINQQVQ